MAAITDIRMLLQSMSPQLSDTDLVFCSLPGDDQSYLRLEPVATCLEPEGLSLVIRREVAVSEGIHFEGLFRRITLTVHSSLHAVGLTAAVASTLAEQGISANVIAAYHHDHILVPAERAEEALELLRSLSSSAEDSA